MKACEEGMVRLSSSSESTRRRCRQTSQPSYWAQNPQTSSLRKIAGPVAHGGTLFSPAHKLKYLYRFFRDCRRFRIRFGEHTSHQLGRDPTQGISSFCCDGSKVRRELCLRETSRSDLRLRFEPLASCHVRSGFVTTAVGAWRRESRLVACGCSTSNEDLGSERR